MMNQRFLILLLILGQFIGNSLMAQTENISAANDQGYTLLKTYCYACHNPEATSRDQMLAPPMIRVKEHYLPVYPNKEEFVKAIVDWVKHPSEEKVMMPGAVRNFNMMPPLAYPDDVLKTIAAYMYDHELEKPKMMGMHGGGHGKGRGHGGHGQGMGRGTTGDQLQKAPVTLNNGKKWDVDDEVMQTMEKVEDQLEKFNGNNADDYRQLGKDVFNNIKGIIMNNKKEGEAFNQLQNFFHGMEGYMHNLMAVKTTEEGEKYKAMLEVYVKTFKNYFQ